MNFKDALVFYDNLPDEIRYAYLRFSNSFFLKNIVITPHPEGGAPAAGSENFPMKSSPSSRDSGRQAAGRDLGPFFDTWFKSYRLPEVEIVSSSVESGETFALSLQVNRTAFASIFPLDVQWVENGVRKQQRIIVDKASQTIVIPTDGKPRRIKIDPGRTFPGRLHEK